MTRHPMFRRSVVFAGLFATYFLRAQDSSWQDNYVRGSEAIRVGRYPDARQLLLEAFKQSQQFPPNDMRRAQTYAVLATVDELQGELKLAGPLYEESRAIFEANGEAGKSSLAFVLDSLGELRYAEGRWAQAEQLLQQSRALHAELDGENSPATMIVVRHLAELYMCIKRYSEAEDLLKQAIAVFRKTERSVVLASALASLGHLYVVQGRYALAETALKEGVALNTRLGDHHPAFADTIVNLAVLYRVENKPERAEPLLRKAAKIYSDAGDPHLAGALTEMGLIALRSGKYITAETNLNQALDIVTKTFGPEHVAVGLVEASLAEVYLGERDYTKAESFIRRALEKERNSLGDSSFEVAKSLLIVAQIEEKQNRQSEADSDYRASVAIYGKAIGANHPEALHARELYSRFAKKMRREGP